MSGNLQGPLRLESEWGTIHPIYIPLAKARYMIRPNISGAGKYALLLVRKTAKSHDKRHEYIWEKNIISYKSYESN